MLSSSGVQNVDRNARVCAEYRFVEVIWAKRTILIVFSREATGGKGGGRPDMAMAGAKDASKLDEALANVYEYVKSL